MAGNGDSVPSAALANLSPNASTLDDVVNSGESTTLGRFTPEYPSGKPIRTLAGIQAEAQEILNNLGLEYPPIAYTAGLTVERNTQTYRYNDVVYVNTRSDLPFTTTGDFDEGGWQVVQQINQSTVIFSADGIKGLDDAPKIDRAAYSVAGFYAGTEVGGGQFIYDASRDKADHNGGTVITPEAIAAWDGTQGGLSVLLDWTGTGTGAFVRIHSIPLAQPEVEISWFGAVGDYDGVSGTDNTKAIQAAVLSSKCVDIGKAGGRYLWSNPVGIDNGINLYQKDLFTLKSSGASIALNTTESALTSYRSLDTPLSTSNLFTAKILLDSLVVEEAGTSTFFNADRLYNTNIRNCSFKGVDVVIKSSIQKDGGYPDGYIQSLFMTGNHFTGIRKIIDAKRAFNVSFTHNMCEACEGGLYIDGLGSPAINTIRVDYNLFEGGGLFCRFGDALGSSIRMNYLESNTLGDVSTENAHIVLIAGGSSFKSWLIEGNQFQDTTAQIGDDTFQDVSVIGAVASNDSVVFRGNWTNSRLSNKDQLTALFSNYEGARSNKFNAPRPTTEAKIDSLRNAADKDIATFTAAGEINAATITIPDGNQANIASVIRVQMALDGRTSGNVQTAAAVVNLSIMINATGTGVASSRLPANHYVEATVDDFMQQPGNIVIDTTGGYTGVTMFSATPAVRIESNGNEHKIWLSNFQNPAATNYGAMSKVRVNSFVSAHQYGDNNYQSARWVQIS